MILSNSGIPGRADFFTHPGDSFRRYFLLQNLDNTPFDATGYVFDFLHLNGSVIQRRFSVLNIAPATTEDDLVFIPVEIEEDVLNRPGVLRANLRATKDESRYTWLAGPSIVSRGYDSGNLEPDVIIIYTDALKVKITILLIPPDGVVVEPEILGLDFMALDSTFILA